MKNTFKVLGLALLVGATMFTACKKDEEDESTKPAATIAINFNGENKFVAEYSAIMSDGQDFIGIAASADSASIVSTGNVNFSMMTSATEAAKKADSWYLWTMNYTSDIDAYMNYFDEEDPYTSGEWIYTQEMAEEELVPAGTVNVYAFDATALTISTTAAATLASMKIYSETGAFQTAPMTIAANNIDLELQAKGSNIITAKRHKLQ